MKTNRSDQGKTEQQEEVTGMFTCFSLVFLFLSLVLSFIL